MKINSVISGLLVVSHISIMLWYYLHSEGWQMENPALSSFWFFGISFLIIGTHMYLASSERYQPVQLKIARFHAIFILVLGTIYAFHYSGIITSNNREKLMAICMSIIAVLFVFVASAWRHGFLNKIKKR